MNNGGRRKSLTSNLLDVYFTNIEKEKNGRKTIFTDLSISSCLVTFAAIKEKEIDHKAVVTSS